MLLFVRFIFALLVGPPVLLALALFFAVEQQPAIKTDWEPTAEDIERAKTIFEGNPIRDNLKTMDLNARDINIALNYLLNNYLPSSSNVTLDNNSIHFSIALKLPKNSFGRYLNLQFSLAKQNGSSHINDIRIGNLQLDDHVAEFLLEKTIKYANLKQHYIFLTEQIIDLDISAEKLTLTYLTDPMFAKNTADLLNQAQDRQAMIFYQQKLTDIINQHDPEWRLSIAELIQPLFAIAHRRSSLKTAIKENRIVIFTINSYVNKDEVLPYLPDNVTAKPRHSFPVFLYKRIDMAKHFIASAMLTSTGGGHLANMIGLEKELSDSVSGSGFSFIDIAGDRAGMRFGKMATASPESARKLQLKMAAIKDYTAFMPDVLDLPEGLDNKQFKRRFANVYSSEYQNMLKEIDRRIEQLPLYQDDLKAPPAVDLKPTAGGLS
ncbi:MAG: hypothetical protein Q7U98_02150 [Methylicorpusculum sp.]|uniref:hypothetical protein n=1 Tax=Methylicorpusculum sp. TaxID=2713644 RepID=UPI00271A4461|nr:hypothetical protein [Methylicorpusculum sp.]MDO8843049.1 hypothetical protein [Methylicorpusculum sp.]MDO8937939.1 hypothetical protein [Methylicorpusculum sp.]MDP2201610.1 hypothetical protein [Methylicorpusculum sp.]